MSLGGRKPIACVHELMGALLEKRTMNNPHVSENRDVDNTIDNRTTSDNDTLHSATHTLMNAPLVSKALAMMSNDFEFKRRKVPAGWPEEAPQFISHLLDVATKLAAWGYDEECVAAGLLHDAVEDLPHLWTKDRIAAEFTPRTAELVDWVTQQDKSLSWEVRNQLYSARLKEAPVEALAISMADKISNISSTLPILKSGLPLTSILKRGWLQNSEKFHELGDLFQSKLPSIHVNEYEEILQIFDALAEPLERIH